MEIIGKGCKYTNRNGRMCIAYRDLNHKRHATTYARFLMEQHLGRELTKDEDVHHIDGDKTNDTIENLEIISKKEHNKHHAEERRKYYDTEEICYICGNPIEVSAKSHYNKASKNKIRDISSNKYFCCKKCAGLFGKTFQYNKTLAIYYEEN